MKKLFLFFAISAMFALSFTSCCDDDNVVADPWHFVATPWYVAFCCEQVDNNQATGYIFLNSKFGSVHIATASLPDNYVQPNAMVPVKVLALKGINELKVEALSGEGLENGWTLNATSEVYRGKVVKVGQFHAEVELTSTPTSNEFFAVESSICFHVNNYPGIAQFEGKEVAFSIVKYIWANDLATDAIPVCVITPAE